MTKAAGTYVIFGTALTASSTGLSYNFDSTGGDYTYFSTGGSFLPSFYCLQANGACIDNDGPGEGILTYNVSTRTPRTGNLQFADAPVGAVPEPASWAFMIGGFGLAGGMMRRRVSEVSYAAV
ncbi:MAG: PEP-CTERM sorting domain-containing protein [Oxalobacteraceae bacterium]|nr:MAG: PEP-CTERM sorting domain-containing protein [Oxalobacteraceae bacterium]